MIQEIEDSVLTLKGPYTNLTPQVKVTELPSRWLSYPKGSEILLRKYTGIELRYFSDSVLSPERELEFVLDGIQTIGFDKKDLTFHDFKYLGLQRRLISLEASKFNVTWFCDKCNNTVTSPIKMEKLHFDDLDIPSLPINAKLSFGTVGFVPITVGNYLKMQKTDREIDENPNIDAIKIWMFLLSFHLQDIDKQAEFYDALVKKGTEKDIRILEEVDRKLYHSITPVEVECPTVITKTKEGSECPITYEDLRRGKVKDLIEWAATKGVTPPEHISFDQNKVVEYIDYKLQVFDHIPCGNKSRVRLSSGSENLISPFRGHEESMDNCISFG